MSPAIEGKRRRNLLIQYLTMLYFMKSSSLYLQSSVFMELQVSTFHEVRKEGGTGKL